MLDWCLEPLFDLAPEPPLNSGLTIEFSEVEAMRCAFGDSVFSQYTRVVGQRFCAEVKSGPFVSALNDDKFAFVISKRAVPDMRRRCQKTACAAERAYR